jgi:diguanylate cyclase (GGDEF)-like protein/PAS domain S-box-containing protein
MVQLRVQTQRMLFVAAAVELYTGASIHMFPGEFNASIYGPVMHWFPVLSAALLISGIGLLLQFHWKSRPWMMWSVPVVAAIPLAGLGLAILDVGGVTGGTAYLVLALALLFVPWCNGTDRAAGSDLLDITLGAIEAIIGWLMITEPGWFASSAFRPIQTVLPYVGLISLAGAACLLATSAFLRAGVAVRWFCRLLAILTPLILTATFLRTETWTGLMWPIWATVSLIRPEAAGRAARRLTSRNPEPASDAIVQMHVTTSRLLAALNWLLIIAVVSLTALEGQTAISSPLRAQLVALLLSASTATLAWTLPEATSARKRIHWQLVFLTLGLGLLISDPAPSSWAFAPLLVAVPIFEGRVSDWKWGLAAALLATITAAGAELALLATNSGPVHPDWSGRTVTLSILVIGGYIGALVGAEHNKLFRTLNDTQQQQARQVEQLALVNGIGAAIRQSLHLSVVLETTATSLGTCLRADRCTILLTGSDLDHGSYEWFDPSVSGSYPARDCCVQIDWNRLLGGGSLVIHDTSDPDIDPALAAHLCDSGTRSIAAVPVRIEPDLLSVIIVRSCECARSWTTEEIEFLEAIAGQVAAAISHAHHHKEIEDSHAQLLEANETLQAQSEELAAQQEELLAQHEELIDQRDELEMALAKAHCAEEALRESEQRFRTAFRDAPIGMSLVKPDGAILQVNQALCTMLGYSEAELLGRTSRDLTHPDDRAEKAEALSHLGAGAVESVQLETRYVHSDGHIVWALTGISAVREETGNTLHLIAHIQDITDRRWTEDQLRHLADYDPLTNLYNRRRFQEELTLELGRTRKTGEGGALLFLDFDQFKYINDSLGHMAGDELLRGLASLLRSTLREHDVIARLGGDEFAVLLPGADQAAAERQAQEILRLVGDNVQVIGDHPVGLTVSVGIALYPEHGTIASHLLANADLAMYQVKEAGRNHYRTYQASTEDRSHLESKLNWERRIRSALDLDQFALHFQPIYDLNTGRIVQHEALIRLVDADGSLISPAEFLGVAESFGLIRNIDRWVVRSAIRTIAEENSKGKSLCVAINLSGRAFSDPDLLTQIRADLTASRVNGSQLVFEITETAAIRDLAHARDFIMALREMGSRFSLDDFGMGFSSFNYLKYLPVDFLKIDGSFIAHLATDEEDRRLVRAIVGSAHALGKQTIAEHVSDQTSIALLRSMGVPYGQGYYLHRPGELLESYAMPEPLTRR